MINVFYSCFFVNVWWYPYSTFSLSFSMNIVVFNIHHVIWCMKKCFLFWCEHVSRSDVQNSQCLIYVRNSESLHTMQSLFINVRLSNYSSDNYSRVSTWDKKCKLWHNEGTTNPTYCGIELRGHLHKYRSHITKNTVVPSELNPIQSCWTWNRPSVSGKTVGRVVARCQSEKSQYQCSRDPSRSSTIASSLW